MSKIGNHRVELQESLPYKWGWEWAEMGMSILPWMERHLSPADRKAAQLGCAGLPQRTGAAMKRAGIFAGVLAIALAGCRPITDEERRAKWEQQQAQLTQANFDEDYRACLYRATGPFGSASAEVMKLCSAAAKEGKRTP